MKELPYEARFVIRKCIINTLKDKADIVDCMFSEDARDYVLLMADGCFFDLSIDDRKTFFLIVAESLK